MVTGMTRGIHQIGVIVGSAMLAVAGGFVGCSTWQTPTTGDVLLKTPRMSPDSVVLELAVLEVPPDAEAQAEDLWRDIDEQLTPLALRRQLAEHGIRGGVLGNCLPLWVRQRLEDQQKMLGLDETSKSAILPSTTPQRRLQCRCGSAHRVDVGQPHQELIVSGQPPDDAAKFQDAQCKLALVPVPRGDGQVQIRLTPEIYHGRARNRWIAEEGVFQLDSRPDCRRYEDLSLQRELLSGQTFVLGGTAKLPPQSLGHAFFARSPENGDGRRLLLIRLAQIQLDDLFAPQSTSPPIATRGP
jgi:hypothetical protein